MFLIYFLKVLDKKGKLEAQWAEPVLLTFHRSNSRQLSEMLSFVKLKHYKERQMTF
jgi:hypothetical protein